MVYYTLTLGIPASIIAGIIWATRERQRTRDPRAPLMRRAQRLVLVGGALAILAVVAMSPRIAIVAGTRIQYTTGVSRFAPVVDLATVGAYVAAITLATVLFWFALSSLPPGRGKDALEGRLDALERDFAKRCTVLRDDISALEVHLTEPEKTDVR